MELKLFFLILRDVTLYKTKNNYHIQTKFTRTCLIVWLTYKLVIVSCKRAAIMILRNHRWKEIVLLHSLRRYYWLRYKHWNSSRLTIAKTPMARAARKVVIHRGVIYELYVLEAAADYKLHDISWRIYAFRGWEKGWGRRGKTSRLMCRRASKSNADKGKISCHRLRPALLQRERRRTLLHNIVVINFLIARSPRLQRGRLFVRQYSLLSSRKPARINLSYRRYRRIPKWSEQRLSQVGYKT